MACMFYFARCMNIMFNSLPTQVVKYDVHTTSKIKFIHAICYHILLLSCLTHLFRTSRKYNNLIDGDDWHSNHRRRGNKPASDISPVWVRVRA